MTIKLRQLNKVDDRVEQLKKHAKRAERAVQQLNGLAWVAHELIEKADDYEIDTSTRAWHMEGFTLDLYFENGIPNGVLETAIETFDKASTYYGGGHAASRAEYDHHLRASVKVRYD